MDWKVTSDASNKSIVSIVDLHNVIEKLISVGSSITVLNKNQG